MGLIQQDNRTLKDAALYWNGLQTRLVEIDTIYADAGFLCKMWQELPKNNSQIFIVGNDHAQALHKHLVQIGFRKTKGKSQTEKLMINGISVKSFSLEPEFVSLVATCITTDLFDGITIHSCQTCNQYKPLQRCSRCKAVSYCSTSCQRKDWKQHKTKCGKLAGQE